MKKLLILLAIAISSNFGSAQEVIKLPEANVNYPSEPFDFTVNGNSFTVKLKEKSIGEFEKNPLAFMESYFDINSLLNKIENKKYDSYLVSFKTRKGQLNAEFNNRGELLSTSARFKNVLIPYDLQHQLYRDYKGWELVKTLHFAKGKKGKIDLDQYVLTMQKGNKKEILKVNREDISVRV